MKTQYLITYLFLSFNFLFSQSCNFNNNSTWLNAGDTLSLLSAESVGFTDNVFFWITKHIDSYCNEVLNLVEKRDINYLAISKHCIIKLGKDLFIGEIYFKKFYVKLFWFLISLLINAILVGSYLLLFHFQRNKNRKLKLLIEENKYELNQTITQLKTSNKLVIESLAEKEILLKEIHHRVTNNLQLIMGLLNMQSQDSKQISIEEFLIKGRYRISAMILIHENLYEKSNLSITNFQNNLENLVKNILNTFNKNLVTIEVNTYENNFDIDTAIPLGLIINELVCNSLKHAFKFNSQGVISIKIFKIEGCNFILEIGDNGQGISKNSSRENSIGLEIVSLLVLQLRGKIHSIDMPGTNYRIEFKEANK